MRENSKRNAEIRKRASQGLSLRELAKLYGISFQRVQQIIKSGSAASSLPVE